MGSSTKIRVGALVLLFVAGTARARRPPDLEVRIDPAQKPRIEMAERAQAAAEAIAASYGERLARLLQSSNPWERREALARFHAGQAPLPASSVTRVVEILDENEPIPSPRCVRLLARQDVIMEDGIRYEAGACGRSLERDDLTNGTLARKLLAGRSDGVLAQALVDRVARHPASVDALVFLVHGASGYVIAALEPVLDDAKQPDAQAALLRLALAGTGAVRYPPVKLRARLDALGSSPDERVRRRAMLLLSIALERPEDKAARERVLGSLRAELADTTRTGLADDVAHLDGGAEPLADALAARLAKSPADLDATLAAIAVLGEAGAPAVPALVARLGKDGGRYDAQIDAAIASLGRPAADRAKPALLAQITRSEQAMPAALRALDATFARLTDGEWRVLVATWRKRCAVRSFGPHLLDRPACDDGDAPLKSIAARNHRKVPPDRDGDAPDRGD